MLDATTSAKPSGSVSSAALASAPVMALKSITPSGAKALSSADLEASCRRWTCR
jgi:hypothetical protein